MYLFFDTETTGLPRNWSAPVTDLSNWPRIIQLAFQVYDKDGNLSHQYCELIKPDGWQVPDFEYWKARGFTDEQANEKGKFWIENGFTTKENEEKGAPLEDVLKTFLYNLETHSQYLIAHNIAYDGPIMGAEMIRKGVKSKVRPVKICTMKSGVGVVPGIGKKWPNLTELHKFLLGKGFDDAHDALADVSATARCFFEMRNRGIIKV